MDPQPVTDVKLTVRDGSTPKAGVKVIFQANDDSVIAELDTDAMGIATTKMPDGGSVSVVRTYGPDVYGQPGPVDHVYTYTGVKPGDVIELAGVLRDDTPFNALVDVGLTNGEFVGVMTPCGSGYGHAPLIAVQLKGCGGETDFYVVNYSGDIGDPHDPPDPNDPNPPPSGPLYFVAHAKLAAMIDLSQETFRGTLSTEYSASNVSGAQIALQKRLVFRDFTVFDTGVQTAPTVTTDVPELPVADQIVTAHVSYAGTHVVISARDLFTSAPKSIDIMGSVIPTSSAPTLAGNLLSWTQAGGGSADFSVADIAVGAVDRQFVHSVVAAHNGTSLRVPVLPATHDKYNGQPTDTPRITHSLVRVTGGYDAARARVFNYAALSDVAPLGGIATASYPSATPGKP
jgi:hypothetical protein